MLSRCLLGGLALVGMASVGCASAAPATAAHHAHAELAVAFDKDTAPAMLARDAELAGVEHHVSLLEGRLMFTVHSTETPEIKTRSTQKGLLYSTIWAKVGPEQTVKCVAYDGVLWAGGLVAADLRGEHDWADDGSEVSDKEAKTKSTLTRLEVSTPNGRTTISGRAAVRDAEENLVADRKTIVQTTPETMVVCSDRAVGFDRRFNAFVGEMLGSMKFDPGPIAPKRSSVYKISVASSKEGEHGAGFVEVNSYVDPKGVTKTFTTEASVVVEDGVITGLDSLLVSTANAKGEETEISSQILLEQQELKNVTLKKDAKGWSKATNVAGFKGFESRLPAKTSPVSVHGVPWNTRLKALAGKKAGSAKLSIFSMFDPGHVSPVVAKRVGDNRVGYTLNGVAHTFTFDADGLRSWDDGLASYERISK